MRLKKKSPDTRNQICLKPRRMKIKLKMKPILYFNLSPNLKILISNLGSKETPNSPSARPFKCQKKMKKAPSPSTSKKKTQPTRNAPLAFKTLSEKKSNRSRTDSTKATTV